MGLVIIILSIIGIAANLFVLVITIRDIRRSK